MLWSGAQVGGTVRQESLIVHATSLLYRSWNLCCFQNEKDSVKVSSSFGGGGRRRSEYYYYAILGSTTSY
jgi:hypothetical protein